MPRGKAASIELTTHEREALTRNVRRRKSASALAMRSRIVLLAASGLTNLRTAIGAFVEANNQAPRPFVWVKTADEILRSIARFAQRTLTTHGMSASSDSGH
jgi:hypothetical protein